MANAACALPAIRLVYVRQQHEAAANVRYLPACTWLHRCSDEIGCCADDSKTCSASNVETVSLPFFVSPLGYHLADLFRHRVNGVSLVIIHGGGPQKTKQRQGEIRIHFSPSCPVLSTAVALDMDEIRPDRNPLCSSFPFFSFPSAPQSQLANIGTRKVNAGLRLSFFFYCSDSLPVSPPRL